MHLLITLFPRYLLLESAKHAAKGLDVHRLSGFSITCLLLIIKVIQRIIRSKRDRMNDWFSVTIHIPRGRKGVRVKAILRYFSGYQWSALMILGRSNEIDKQKSMWVIAFWQHGQSETALFHWLPNAGWYWIATGLQCRVNHVVKASTFIEREP